MNSGCQHQVLFFIFLGGPEFQEFPGEQTSPSLLLKKKKKTKTKE